MGLIHIYCGDGKGKTTASVGLSIRASGSGMKVLFVQFFKNGNSSELKNLNLIPNITCLHSDKAYSRYVNMDEDQKEKAEVSYTQLLQEAIEISPQFDMVILDEVISAYHYNMIAKEQLLDFIVKNTKLEIIMTGRNPSEELMKLADYISHIAKVKHPFDKGEPARKGIEF